QRTGRVEHRFAGTGRDRPRVGARQRRPGRARHHPRCERASRCREVGERTIDLAELPHETVHFAHNSERQFAKLLDFYNIAWDYEPRTFALARDREGPASQAFTPDFHLPR